MEGVRHLFDGAEPATWAVIELLGRFLDEGKKTLTSSDLGEIKASRTALLKTVRARPLSAADAQSIKKHVGTMSLDSLSSEIGSALHSSNPDVTCVAVESRTPDLLLRVDRLQHEASDPMRAIFEARMHFAFDRIAFDVEAKAGMNAVDLAAKIAGELASHAPELQVEILPAGAGAALEDYDSTMIRIRRAPDSTPIV